ncbi:MAG: hypothetical protein J3R72DRAFT_143506 [Linnemannia gamsii]|nr:MAG: hypothetical protein J3R72DRAFT_143506 [Linnemannia gamsii]
MSSAKPRSKGGNSPTSSPPLPPAPSQAKNRGSAAPHHFQTELASAEATAAAAAAASKSSSKAANGRGGFTPPRTGSPAAKQRGGNTRTPQAPPTLANGNDIIHSTSLQKRFSLRGLVARVLLLFLSYTFFFVCPSLPDTKSNLVCDRVAAVEGWLRPYAEPVVVKVGETYKTYAEPYVDQYGRPLYDQGQKYYKTYAVPYVDQYGRPLYDQGQKYYVDIAQPAIKTASAKAKDAYHQYAHPHVNKAYETVYSPKVKAHVNRAQTAFNGYQKQAQEQLVYARKWSQDANDNVWRLHAAHVQPVVDKVTPHAKVAWDHASMGAARAYDTASDLYLKHVNPYAQQSITIILDAADNARESLAFHTDEIWGTKLSKRHKKSKAARAADRAADKAQQAKAALEKAARDTAKKFKHEPEPETLKDTLLKKAADAQKLAEEYAEGAKEAIHDTVVGAQKVASDEAQYLRKMADEGTHEAGKLSERIKKTVIEKAHKAQEAVARQAENLRHAAQEQVEHVQEAGAHLRDRVVGATHDTKEAIDKEAEYLADVASKKKTHMEKLAKEQAAAAKLAAQQKEKEARKLTDQATHKVQETYDAAADEANEIKDKVVRTAHDADHAIRKQAEEVTHQAQQVFEYAEEQTEEARSKAAKAAKKARKAARKQAKELKRAAEQMAHDGQEYLDIPAEAAANAKEYVVQHAKDASDQATEAKEATRQKVLNAHTASKASLTAMLAGIEASFGHFYDYEDTETKNLWSKLQSAIDEHVESAKKSAQNLEKANRKAYESFESYVRDWRNQGGGDLEDRLSQLKQQSVESLKIIGQRAENDQTAAKSKVKVLANNVDVYLNGLKDFLADRLEASKETIASELSVFKDTSSKDDEETVQSKLAQLETAARARLDSAGKDAHAKAQQLLKQVDEIWSKSEIQSRELAEKTQELAKKASEDAKLMIQHAVGSDDKKSKGKKEMIEEVEDAEAPGSLKSKIQSVKDATANRAQEASGKLNEMINDRKETGSTGDAEANNVRVAMEEPGSGHRHQHH